MLAASGAGWHASPAEVAGHAGPGRGHDRPPARPAALYRDLLGYPRALPRPAHHLRAPCGLPRRRFPRPCGTRVGAHRRRHRRAASRRARARPTLALGDPRIVIAELEGGEQELLAARSGQPPGGGGGRGTWTVLGRRVAAALPGPISSCSIIPRPTRRQPTSWRSVRAMPMRSSPSAPARSTTYASSSPTAPAGPAPCSRPHRRWTATSPARSRSPATASSSAAGARPARRVLRSWHPRGRTRPPDPGGPGRHHLPLHGPGRLAALPPPARHGLRRDTLRADAADEPVLYRQVDRLLTGDLDAMLALTRLLVLSGLGVLVTAAAIRARWRARDQPLHRHFARPHPGTADGQQVGLATWTVARLQAGMLASRPSRRGWRRWPATRRLRARLRSPSAPSCMRRAQKPHDPPARRTEQPLRPLADDPQRLLGVMMPLEAMSGVIERPGPPGRPASGVDPAFYRRRSATPTSARPLQLPRPRRQAGRHPGGVRGARGLMAEPYPGDPCRRRGRRRRPIAEVLDLLSTTTSIAAPGSPGSTMEGRPRPGSPSGSGSAGSRSCATCGGRETGLVQIRSTAALASCVALERRLERRFGLSEAVVIPTPSDPENLPVPSASHSDLCFRPAEPGQTIGSAGVARCTGACARCAAARAGTRPSWHCSAASVAARDQHLTTTASRLAELVGAQCYYLAAPDLRRARRRCARCSSYQAGHPRHPGRGPQATSPWLASARWRRRHQPPARPARRRGRARAACARRRRRPARPVPRPRGRPSTIPSTPAPWASGRRPRAIPPPSWPPAEPRRCRPPRRARRRLREPPDHGRGHGGCAGGVRALRRPWHQACTM